MPNENDEQFVGNYLQNNQIFTKSWFVKNAPKDFIQEWFNQRRDPPRQDKKLADDFFLKETEQSGTLNSRDALFVNVTSLLSNESDTTLMNEELLSASYAKIARNGRNSITLELFYDILARGSTVGQSDDVPTRQQLIEKFQGMNEHEMFMNLITDVTNELDIDRLCYKILVNVCILTNSDRSSLFLAKGSRENRYLVAKLFDVTPESTLQQVQMSTEKYKKIPPLPFGTGIVGHVAQNKNNVNIKDAYEDARFNKNIDLRTGYHTKSLMCQPILNFGGDVVGVAECINKLSEESKFTQEDEKVFQKYLTFCGIGIQNAQLFEMSILEYKRNQLLLSLTKTIFEDTSSLDVLLNKVIIKANDILDCDKCRVYLINNMPLSEDMSQITQVFENMFEYESKSKVVNKIEVSEISDQGDLAQAEYARQVAVTAKTLKTSLEGVNMDESVLCDSILSVPIHNNVNKIIGVAQLVRTGGRTFTEIDVMTLEAFSMFCGLGIHNCVLYEEAIKLNASQQVALEVLSYHASATLDEANELMRNSVQNAEVYNVNSMDFDDLALSDKETCLATVRMFMELNFLETYNIPYTVLCRWVLSVKKNYRQACNLKTIMSQNEQLALIIASMCHDLDHRGTNNSFQSKSGSPLATLYSTSIMENHHFYHCLLILNAEGNEILKSLTAGDYKEVVKIIENCILSTDLEQYFRKKDKFAELVGSNDVDWNDSEKKDLLRAMLMTSCDLSAICKPWHIQKRVAELVASEFFEQGDMEKSMQQTPIAMMDRSKKGELPSMYGGPCQEKTFDYIPLTCRQVGFIDHIGAPLYKLLNDFWPQLEPFYTGCLNNRDRWQNLVKQTA